MTHIDQFHFEDMMARCSVRGTSLHPEIPPPHNVVKIVSSCASKPVTLNQQALKADKISDKQATNNNNSNNSGNNDNDSTSSSKSDQCDQALDLMETVTIKQVPDGDGAPITLGRLYGVWTAPWTSLPEQISRAQRFTFDDSDVILLGYAKSGSHWLWEILHMLLRNKAEHCQTPKERLMLSFSTQEYFDTMATPRVFNTHAPFVALPIAIKSGRNKCKMVYILRNPKDLAVSYYHHLKAAKEFEYDGSFRGFLQLFIEGQVPGGSWFDYVLEWEQTLRNNPHLPILTVRYEDLKEDLVRELRKISSFLEIERSVQLYEAIASECSINRMKEVDETLKDQFPVTISKTGKNFIYRKGVVGDWKNWFSVADNERFDCIIAEKLKNSQLRFRYEINTYPECVHPQTGPEVRSVAMSHRFSEEIEVDPKKMRGDDRNRRMMYVYLGERLRGNNSSNIAASTSLNLLLMVNEHLKLDETSGI